MIMAPLNRDSSLSDYKDSLALPQGKIIELSSELERPCPIYFGNGIHDHFVTHLEKYDCDQVFFFTEEHLFNLHGRAIYEKIEQNITCNLKFVPSGETCKSFTVLEEICEDLIAKGVSKRSILVAFGGGTVGNIIGLVSGLIYRGIRFIEVPTSMTGQTDSTLSNKQAINGKSGKNHFGLYHSPIFIWTDTKYLETEPLNSKRCGVIEGIKNGFIAEPDFLNYLEDTLNPELCFSEDKLTELAYKIILSKLEIIKKDPSEKHYGIILEYGHTFGHAIEWLQKGKTLHGEAVSFGMKIAAELSQALGLISDQDVERHYFLIEDKLGFRSPLPDTITTENLLDAMIADNKKTGKDIRFVLLEKIGQCYNFELQALKANEIGCHLTLCYIPPFSHELNFNDSFIQTSNRLKELKWILEKYNIKIGFEFIGPTETRKNTKYDFIHTIDGTRALIASAGLYGYAGFKLDVHHWQNSGGSVLDIQHLDLEYILYIELNDGLPGYDIFNIPEFERELPLKTGITKIQAFIRALQQKGYQGPVAVEPWNQSIKNMPLEKAIQTVKQSLDQCFKLVQSTS